MTICCSAVQKPLSVICFVQLLFEKWNTSINLLWSQNDYEYVQSTEPEVKRCLVVPVINGWFSGYDSIALKIMQKTKNCNKRWSWKTYILKKQTNKNCSKALHSHEAVLQTLSLVRQIMTKMFHTVQIKKNKKKTVNGTFMKFEKCRFYFAEYCHGNAAPGMQNVESPVKAAV